MNHRLVTALVAVGALAFGAGCGDETGSNGASDSPAAAAGSAEEAADETTADTAGGSDESTADTTGRSTAPEETPAAPPDTPAPRGPDQRIEFPPLGEDHIWPDNSAPLAASASSGLPVEYRIEEDTGVCILEPDVVRVEQLGGCTIVASQPGSAEFDPAPEVARKFYVGGQRLTVQITDLPASASFASTPSLSFTVIVSPTTGQPFESRVSIFTDGDCFADGGAPVTDATPQEFTVELRQPSTGSCTVSAQAAGQFNFSDPTAVTFVVEP